MSTLTLPLAWLEDAALTPEPPAQRHSETSLEAADLIRPYVNAMQAEVLDYLCSLGEAGATDIEGVAATGMNPSTWRPRRGELEDAGLVLKTEAKRPTGNGKATAYVYVATERGHEALRELREAERVEVWPDGGHLPVETWESAR